MSLRDALYVALDRRLGALLVTAAACLAQPPALGIAVKRVASPRLTLRVGYPRLVARRLSGLLNRWGGSLGA